MRPRRKGKRCHAMIAQLCGPARTGIGVEISKHTEEAAAAINGPNKGTAKEDGADCLAPTSRDEACLLSTMRAPPRGEKKTALPAWLLRIANTLPSSAPCGLRPEVWG